MGGVGSQLLMLTPKMLKFKIQIFTGGGGGWPTFGAESKNAKIQNSHFHRCDVGSRLLMLNPKMLKFKIQIFTGGWVGEGGWGLVANF